MIWHSNKSLNPSWLYVGKTSVALCHIQCSFPVRSLYESLQAIVPAINRSLAICIFCESISLSSQMSYSTDSIFFACSISDSFSLFGRTFSVCCPAICHLDLRLIKDLKWLIVNRVGLYARPSQSSTS